MQSRRVWFFYEWLMDKKLGLPDADSKVRYIDALDDAMKFAGKTVLEIFSDYFDMIAANA